MIGCTRNEDPQGFPHICDLAEDLACVEMASEAYDSREFRRALGRFATGVAIATTDHDGTPVGLTINSFSSVSLEPPLVLWSLRSDASTLDSFVSSQRYAINVLSVEQRGLASRFAKHGSDKFIGVRYRTGLGDCPLLPSCLAYFECRLVDTIVCGDHLVLLGAVERASHRDGEPLVFSSGGYQVANPPNSTASQLSS